MLGQTEIVLLVLVVLVVAVFFIWRSRQRVRTAKKTGKIRGDYAVEDVLMKSGEKEAPRKTEPTLAPEAEGKSISPAAAADAAPSDIPPVYDVIEEEEERKRAAEEAARANAEEADASPVPTGSEWPAVDTALEWVLDISAPDNTTFKMGGLDSLRRELRALNLKLPLFVWTRSAEDGLYYECDRLQKSADHVVVAVVLANRAAQLDELTASSVLQVLETVATQYDINVRLSQEIPEAVTSAKTLRQFIRYYDNRLELEVVPLDPSVDFTLDAVAKLALASGFEQNRGGFEYRASAESLAPEITLSLTAAETRGLRLSLDLPLVHEGRGDFSTFLRLANHFCGHLHAALSDCNGKPIGTAEAMYIEEAARERMRAMKKAGVVAGSERARLLFSSAS